MKELLVEVGKVGESEDVGDLADDGAGGIDAPENCPEVCVAHAREFGKANKTDPPPSCLFFYNSFDAGWHDGDKYTSNDVPCQALLHHTRCVNKWETLPKVDAVSLPNRLRALRNALRLSQKEFAERLGKGLATIQRWESGQTEPNDKTLRLISHTFGVSYEWLKEGKGEMFVKPKPNARIIPEEEIIWVPIVAKVGAGYPVDQGDIEVRGHFPIPRHVWESLPKGTFVTEVSGDSMEPTLHEGDVVAAKPYEGSGDDIPNGKVVIVADANGELVVKRLKHIGGRPVLTSDNPKYEPIYPDHEHRIIGIGITAWKRTEL